MKINPISQSDAVKQMTINSATATASPLTVEISDSLELSEGARKYSELIRNARKAMEASDAEEAAAVSDITARIGNNTYKVSDEDVVNNILGGFPSNR
jgi:anti-sigma28 factor (negative regulator of flagellin synthesis)